MHGFARVATVNKLANDPTVTLRWLGQVAQYVAAGRPLPYHLSLFVLQGLSPFLETAGEVSLDQAFGTRRHGGISISNAAKNAQRDDMLRHLRNIHPEWSVLAPSVASRRMRQAFERYEAGRWKREKSATSAPSSEPFTTFWRVLNAGMRMPQEARLRQILEREIQEAV
jgi:hypothetical protein